MIIEAAHEIVEKVKELLDDPVVATTVGVSNIAVGAANAFSQDVQMIHDTLSLVSMFLGCIVAVMVIRVWILKGNLLKLEERQKTEALENSHEDSSKT